MDLTQTVKLLPHTLVPRVISPDSDRNAVRSVDRAIALLVALGELDQPTGVTELAARLGLHKSTVSRLLLTLRKGGLVEQEKGTSAYRLGVALVRLGCRAEKMLDLRAIALPALAQVSISVQETSALASLRDGRVAPIAWSDSAGISHDRSDRTLPVHATAVGKVLLSSLPEREVVGLAKPGLTPYTPNTIVRIDMLLEELARVRRRGFATAFGESEPTVNAVAVPVFDQRAAVVAALEVRGVPSRVHPSRVPELLARIRDAAASITEGLGGVAATAYS
jgi:IclR family transcriptional regulator, acetate operon repressor